MNARLLPSALAALGLALALVSSFGVADAALFRGRGQMVVPAGDTLRDDLYICGGKVDIAGVVQGDVVACGGNVNLSGAVTGSMMSGAGSTRVSGSVGRTLRCGSGEVQITGSVGDDLLAGCGRLVLARDARIGRDLLAGGGQIDLDGSVGRNVYAGTGELSIAGDVGGNVRATSGRTRLLQDASVKGDFIYTSDRSMVRAPGASIGGRIEQRVPSGRQRHGPIGRMIGSTIGFMIGWERALVGLLAIGLLLVLPFPGFTRRTLDALGGSPAPSLGVGLLMFFAVPFVALTAGVIGLLIGGWWLGLTLMVLFGASLMLGIAVTGAFLGARLLNRPGRDVRLVWALLAGLAILTFVTRVPILGICVAVLSAIFGLGALTIAARRGRMAPAT